MFHLIKKKFFCDFFSVNSSNFRRKTREKGCTSVYTNTTCKVINDGEKKINVESVRSRPLAHTFQLYWQWCQAVFWWKQRTCHSGVRNRLRNIPVVVLFTTGKYIRKSQHTSIEMSFSLHHHHCTGTNTRQFGHVFRICVHGAVENV